MASKSALRPLHALFRPRQNLARSVRRAYHSADHPPPPGPFNDTESLILSSAAPHIPTHGFTLQTLSLGAKDAGYIDASTNLFPSGAFALVLWHLYQQRLALSNRCPELFHVPNGTKPLGIGAKVKALTLSRLLSNAPIISHYQSALALMASPSNIPACLRELHALSDEIWYLAGDVAVDGSWYTKRASLSSIYAASELFMTTDKSEGFRETSEFLERRLQDSMALGKLVGGIGQWVGFTASAAVHVARSRGVRI